MLAPCLVRVGPAVIFFRVRCALDDCDVSAARLAPSAVAAQLRRMLEHGEDKNGIDEILRLVPELTWSNVAGLSRNAIDDELREMLELQLEEQRQRCSSLQAEAAQLKRNYSELQAQNAAQADKIGAQEREIKSLMRGLREATTPRAAAAQQATLASQEQEIADLKQELQQSKLTIASLNLENNSTSKVVDAAISNQVHAVEDDEDSDDESDEDADGDEQLSADQLAGLPEADQHAIQQMAALGAFKRGSFAFRAGASHTPPPGTRFKCVKRAVIRADFDHNSAKIGHFEVGEVLEARECRLNEMGQLRLRFDRGWGSVAAGSGALLFTKQA
eukprot:SAG31_NODE_2003_length_6688_cov_2.812415_3_plen_332_part_00